MTEMTMQLDKKSVSNRLTEIIRSTIPAVSFPIISKGESWIRVNDILIDQADDRYRVKRRGTILSTFQKRSLAIAYAVAFCQGDFSSCKLLERASFKLDKYQEEIGRYGYQLSLARKSNNIFRENVLSDRLSRTLIDYEATMDEISHIIKTPSLV